KYASYMQCIFNYNGKMVFLKGYKQHKNTINCMYIARTTLRPEKIIDTKNIMSVICDT
ncbi:hypothetical protein IU318_005296, partial [Escherichia coli]|nr:hypothetical protein [Escherichia coli]EGO6544358.1 hypothetical protein [Escherichia coli]